MKHRPCKLISLIIIVSFMGLMTSAGSMAQPSQVVRVGLYENEPKIFTDASGRAAGFWPELLAFIGAREDWKIEYVHGSWNLCLERLSHHQIDIMPDTAQTEIRSQKYMFSKTPVLVSCSRVYIQKKNPGIFTITDLEDKTVAVLSGSVNYVGEEGIRDIAKQFNIHCRFMELDSYIQVFEAVAEGRADAGVTNRNFGDQNTPRFDLQKTAIIFQPINIKFAFPKQSPLSPALSARIDFYMEQMAKDNQSLYYQLLEKYFETNIAEKTVEVLPKWLGTFLKTTGVIAVFLLSAILVSRLQVKLKTKQLKEKNLALMRNQAHLRTLIQTIPDLVWLKDPEGVYLSCNAKFERFFGAGESEIRGKTDYDFVDKDLADFFRENDQAAMQAGGPVLNEEEVTYADDGHNELLETIKTPMFDSDGKLIGVLGIARDITARRRTEEEKIKAQELANEHGKMALVGKIAGKLAHDFNNILGIIMGNTELSLLTCNDTDMKKSLELVLNQTLRGRNLTRNLVAFAKDQEPKQEFFKLSEKVDLVLNLLRKDLEGISIIRNDQPDLPELLADPGMIEHTLVNLIQNAIHALSLSQNPTLSIRTHGTLEHLCFEIEDNGCGIPTEYLDSIFEPFFTLKGNKDRNGSYADSIKGTGYGMANVKRYIDQHAGHITVLSELGSGTKIVVRLPLIQKELTEQEKILILQAPHQQGKSILLVEDETAISNIQYRILTQAPCLHLVDVAANGEAALDLFHKKKHHLVSLDYMLPGKMNGMDIYHHIRQHDPTLPILFISGNINFLESINLLMQNDPHVDHLAKPCQHRDYIDKINSLLAAAKHELPSR